ncbi:hypothetical protein A3B60_00760 [Candidatus Peregrinibacteria bacterium RIFCSPLOWO2_01_FULL_39_12]|nr:MAG: hypothetical protein A3B60_00760 [Candidatus Peregrinibacteria bacterium RIFCSPLOWO2_01_FULL_39_12]
MSLESFISLDQGEGGSEQALEALREKMRAAAAQIAAIQKEEGKQKKKEEDLLKILLKFIKTSQKKELVLLISRVLEQNIPANFILAIILLGNEDIQREVGRYLMLKPGEAVQETSQEKPSVDEKSSHDEKLLVFFSEKDSALPLKVRIELDNWLKDLLFQAGENPQKLLRTAYKIEMVEKEKENEWDDPKYEEIKTPSLAVIHLMAFVMRDFLSQEKIEEQHEKLYEFAEFMFTGILNKTEEMVLNRKLLK